MEDCKSHEHREISYLSLLFTTVFLDWFSTSNLFIIILGYVESAIIFVVTTHFMLERINKTRVVSKNSHPSDWFFVIGMVLLGFTAFFVRLFIDLKILEQNSWMYLFHLTIFGTMGSGYCSFR